MPLCRKGVWLFRPSARRPVRSLLGSRWHQRGRQRFSRVCGFELASGPAVPHHSLHLLVCRLHHARCASRASTHDHSGTLCCSRRSCQAPQGRSAFRVPLAPTARLLLRHTRARHSRFAPLSRAAESAEPIKQFARRRGRTLHLCSRPWLSLVWFGQWRCYCR